MGVVLSFQPKTGSDFLKTISSKIEATAKLWLGESDSSSYNIELDIMKLLTKLKRLDVVLISRIVGDAEVRIQPVQD